MLAFVGCGVDAAGFGTYVLDSDSIRVEYEIPAALNDPYIIEIERIRAELKGSPPSFYVRVVVDNSKGSTAFAAAGVVLIHRGGQRNFLQPVGLLIRQWANASHPNESLKPWAVIADQPRFSGSIAARQSGSVILVPSLNETDIVEVVTQDGRQLRRLPN